MTSFNMSTWVQVDIDTNLYETVSINSSADYILNINMDAATFFTSAHYKQNSDDATKYDVKLELNQTCIFNGLNDSSTTIVKDQALNTNNFSASGTAGKLLLEVMSKKIFNHPKAFAAIANDTMFIGTSNDNLMYRIASNLHTTYTYELIGQGSNDNITGIALDVKNLFESYVSIGRIDSADDTNNWVKMNYVAGDVFSIPFYIRE